MRKRACPAVYGFGIVLLLALTLRLGAVFFYHHMPEGDELSYQTMASNFLGGLGLMDQYGNRAMFNAGYPLMVLTPVFWVFGENLFAVRLCNILLGLLSVWMVWRVALKVGMGREVAFFAALMAALYLPSSVYGVYLMKENLMIPLMLGVAWCALDMQASRSVASSLLCGLMLGLLALVGNAALVLFLMAGYALAFSTRSPARKLMEWILVFVVALAVASPWLIRNMNVLGAPILNTNGGFNLYIGNNPAATGLFVSIADTPMGSAWEALRSTGEVRASNVLKEQALAWMKDHPAAFVALAIKKAGYFWLPPFHQGQGDGSTVERLIRLAWLVQYVLIVSLAVFAVVKYRSDRKIHILLVGTMAYFAAHTVFYVIFRYREPIMPFMIVMAAAGVGSIFARFKESSHSLRET